MKNQLSKLSLRLEDLKDKEMTPAQLEKVRGGKTTSGECVCNCACYTGGDSQGLQFNDWSRDWA